MTHWDTYNLFERLIFLIGYFAIWYVLVKLMARLCKAWDGKKLKRMKAQKPLGSKDNHIDWRGVGRMKDFKIGDRVIVKDNGCSFTTYRDFFKENGLEKFERYYAEFKSIPQGKTYAVVGVGKHSSNIQYGPLYVLQSEDGKIYIGNNINNFGSHDYMELAEGGKVMKFKVGDKVIPVDGSWSITTKEGGLKPTCGVSINKRKWEVISTDISIPPIDYNGKFKTDECWQGAYVRNDLALKCIEDGEIIFICSCNCKLIPQPIPFPEAVKAAIAGKRPTIVLNGHKYTLSAEKSMLHNVGFWIDITSGDSTKRMFATGMLDGMWTVEE
jgi:hypothetical protein